MRLLSFALVVLTLALVAPPPAAEATPSAPASLEAAHPDTPPNAAAGAVALLALAALGVVKGNVGAISIEHTQVLTGDHPAVTRTRPVDADLGKRIGGEVLGWDSTGDGAVLTEILPDAEALGVGDGTETDFEGDFGGPLEPGSVRVTAGAVTLVDDRYGRLAGVGGSGTVNYATGEVTVAFTAAPANAVAVSATAYREIEGVLLREADAASDGQVPVVVHGTVSRAALRVNGDVGAADLLLELLGRRGIYAV